MLYYRFTGNLISGNHCNKFNSKTGKYFHDKKYDAFLTAVEVQWRKQFGYKIKPTEWVIEVIYIIYRNNRRLDFDNAIKVINDSLNGLAWKDDCQIKKGNFEVIDGEKPGFSIKILPILREPKVK